MQLAASALAFLAILSQAGTPGPVCSPNETGIFFVMAGGLVLFGIFAAFSAVLFLTGDSAEL